ncbi:hypothetical protein AVEN_218899-1 [Araneus ventricosus]|uniref:Uncharacterized protein n=1 Tax=Araneus ventricosus TaxID=182803 RepID=A0A4Y2S2D6_ARAVE|nr:hypothetical protein AVEN_218899-1 [Araneus ventricosus]
MARSAVKWSLIVFQTERHVRIIEKECSKCLRVNNGLFAVVAQISSPWYDLGVWRVGDYGFKRRGLPPNGLCLQNGPSRPDAHV